MPDQATIPNLGAIYTRRWVVELMLDLAGYRSGAAITDGLAIEPCCGDGAFVLPMVERLLESAARVHRPVETLRACLAAWDIDPDAVATTREKVTALLTGKGVATSLADSLARSWIRQGDFLRSDLGDTAATWIVGNPPYIRLEEADPDAAAIYRRTWTTMRGRADIYIGFFEAALGMLTPSGTLVFLCADRWLKNQYGKALRELVDTSYRTRLLFDVHDVDVFAKKVAAYPAIFVIEGTATPQRPAMTGRAESSFDHSDALLLTDALRAGAARNEAHFSVHPTNGARRPGDGWALASRADLDELDQLAHLPVLADTGVSISAGVATGADAVFILPSGRPIEAERMLKVVGPKDLRTGRVEWQGRWLVNTWDDDGVVPLGTYPEFDRQMSANEELLRKRHVGRNDESRWWRTIDRPKVAAYRAAKLLVADINDRVDPVLDEDGYTPMHSLYYLQSTEWNLKSLGGLLMSDIVARQMAAHSLKMAGGRIRVTSQYLRKLRVPLPDTLSAEDLRQLAEAFEARDQAAADDAARRAYRLT
jgi:adenine-specific DNA-methyltransferase